MLVERTRYNASLVEPEVLQRWIDAHAFEARADDPGALRIHPPGTRHWVESDAGCIVLAIYERPVRFLEA